MNWPNVLTVLRLILAAAFIILALTNDLSLQILAAICFAVAALTDFLDGYLAKKKNCITSFGIIMDPIADKILILSAFFILSRVHLLAGWMFYAIFLREVSVTFSRLSLLARGKVIAAEMDGKIKTVLQIIAICFGLGLMIASKSLIHIPQIMLLVSFYILQVLMFLAFVMTTISGVKYFWNNRRQWV